VNDPVFKFQARWKEELICSSSHGSFILEMPMGIVSVYLPTESVWERVAPEWAKTFWETIHKQLSEWCVKEKIPLYIDESANVYANSQ